MIKAVILSDDTDLGHMFELMFQKMGHLGIPFETTEELIQQTRDKAFDILILEGIHSLKIADWTALSEEFSNQSNPLPIIITSMIWNKNLEARCAPLRIEEILIYPCDIPNSVISTLTNLFPNESFKAWWNKDNTEN